MIKKILTILILLSAILLNGCSLQKNNKTQEQTTSNINKNIVQKDIILKWITDPNDIKILNNFINTKKISDKDIKKVKNKLLQQLLTDFNIFKKDYNWYLNKKDKKINNKIITDIIKIQNNPIYKNNLFLVKTNINDYILWGFYYIDNLLSKDNEILNNDCNALSKANIVKKDQCLFEVSKTYNIDLCDNIKDNKLKNTCLLYQMKGYSQFNSIKECVTNKNIKDNQFRITWCLKYFYKNNYEHILHDYQKIVPLIQKRFVDSIKKTLIYDYVKILKNNKICSKYYKDKKNIENCYKETNIQLCKQTDNLEYCKKIEDTKIRNFIYNNRYYDIINLNDEKNIVQNNLCDLLKDEKKQDTCYFLLTLKTFDKKYCSKIKNNVKKKGCINISWPNGK